ncbi:MAG: PaaI family thioesterase [Acidimicrobiales bacterium]
MFDNPWVEFINPQPIEVEPRKLTLAHTPTEAHLNHHGHVAAGVVFSLVEMAGVGILVIAVGDAIRDCFIVAKACDIQFIRPATGTIRATSTLPSALEPIDIINSLDVGIEQKIPVEVFNDSHVKVASATVTGVIRQIRDSS